MKVHVRCRSGNRNEKNNFSALSLTPRKSLLDNDDNRLCDSRLAFTSALRCFEKESGLRLVSYEPSQNLVDIVPCEPSKFYDASDKRLNQLTI